MINRKAEIALAAAKVENPDFSLGREQGIDVLDMLEKSVYLSKLTLLFVMDAAVL